MTLTPTATVDDGADRGGAELEHQQTRPTGPRERVTMKAASLCLTALKPSGRPGLHRHPAALACSTSPIGELRQAIEDRAEIVMKGRDAIQ